MNATTDTAKNPSTFEWSLAAYCLLLILLSVLYAEPGSTDAARVFGQSLVYGLVAAIPFSLAAIPGKTNKKVLLAFIAIVASFQVGRMIAANTQEANAKEALGQIIPEFEKDVSRVEDAARTFYGPTPSDSAPDAKTPEASLSKVNPGSKSLSSRDEAAVQLMQQIQTGFRWVVDRQLAMQQSYQADLAAAGLNSLLDPQRLKADPTGNQGKAILERSRAALIKHRQIFEKYYGSMIEDFKQFVPENEHSKGFYRGMRDSFPRGLENTTRSWDYEEKILHEFTALVALFKSAQGWDVVDGNLMFPTDAQAEEYNQRLARIDSYSREQQALIEEGQRGLRNALSTMKDIVQ
ncbi:hypothetical protein [Methyloversatilis discipulorum]|uniref:hypothetical protein n=1 Tax=Methyloversatilis discipulorum TaxID=1119528 RepID=UPI0012FBFC7C|nr:hypothetical protein [Methyloversatilis discipulorum]